MNFIKRLMSNNKQINVIAIDISGSTSGCRHYFENVKKILDQVYDESYMIIEWNGDAKITSKNSMLQRINGLNGEGWTSPSSIIRLLMKKSIKRINHLVLITDGQVSTSEIDKCDHDIKSSSMTFQKFDGYIIGNRYANMSVTCPFTRSCSHTVTQSHRLNQITSHKQLLMYQMKILRSLKRSRRLMMLMNS